MWDIGVDIVEVDRFRRITYFSHKRLYNRVFTLREIDYCLLFRNPAQHFAATFAGKEAIYKALNKHLNIKFHEIEILRDKNGIPQVNLKIENKDKVKNFNQKISLPIEVKVSLSHSSSHAIAFVVVRLQQIEIKSE